MKSSVIVCGQRSYLNITWRKSAEIQFFSNAWISKSAALESDLANNNTTIQRFIPMRKLPQFLLVTLYLVYKYTLNKEMFTFFNAYYYIHRALARKKKNSAFCMNWKKKRIFGSGGHYEQLSGISGRPGGKAFRKFTIFSLKLIWYNLL